MEEGSVDVLNGCLIGISKFRGFSVPQSEPSFLVSLGTHPSALIRARADTALRSFTLRWREAYTWEHRARIWNAGVPIPIRRIASELKQKGRPLDPPTILPWREKLKDSDPAMRYQAIWILE